MKRKWLLIVIIMFVFLISGCKTNQTKEATGYGITYKDYVGMAKVTVKDDVVDKVTFDEIYLPSTWAKIQKGTETEIPNDIVASGTNWYGRYLVIGDKHFTGTVRDNPLVIEDITYSNQSVKYTSSDIPDLYVWLRDSEANDKWYATEVLANRAFIAKADWTKSDYQQAGVSGWTKSTTNYWPSGTTGLGWVANMSKIAQALKGTKMDASDKLEKTNDGWTINGVQSGATNSSFVDYYAVAKRAYDNAMNAK